MGYYTYLNIEEYNKVVSRINEKREREIFDEEYGILLRKKHDTDHINDFLGIYPFDALHFVFYDTPFYEIDVLTKTTFYNVKVQNRPYMVGVFNGVDYYLRYIYTVLRSVYNPYPNFDYWFYTRVLYGLHNGEREVILKWDVDKRKLKGFSIIKNTDKERKICCLRVCDDYLNTGVGVKLFEKSMERLNTNRPFLTVCDSNWYIESFKKIFRYFGYEKCGEFKDYYLPGKTELCFNGLLEYDKNLIQFADDSY